MWTIYVQDEAYAFKVGGADGNYYEDQESKSKFTVIFFTLYSLEF
jgi:hypothetical protein